MTKEWAIQSATLCVDNQATIRATQVTKPHPGHYLTDIFHRDLKALKKKHNSIWVVVRWTPGHKGIEGNEQANEQAKKVITEGSSNTSQPAIPQKTATTKQICGQTSIQQEVEMMCPKVMGKIAEVWMHEKPWTHCTAKKIPHAYCTATKKGCQHTVSAKDRTHTTS